MARANRLVNQFTSNDRWIEYNKAKEVIQNTFDSRFYDKDTIKDFLVAYLMGMGWAYDEALDVVYEPNSLMKAVK